MVYSGSLHWLIRIGRQRGASRVIRYPQRFKDIVSADTVIRTTDQVERQSPSCSFISSVPMKANSILDRWLAHDPVAAALKLFEDVVGDDVWSRIIGAFPELEVAAAPCAQFLGY